MSDNLTDTCLSNQVETFDTILDVLALYQASRINRQGSAVLQQVNKPECALPLFQKPTETKFPEYPQSDLNVVVKEYCDLFQTTPGNTEVSQDFIPTTGKYHHGMFQPTTKMKSRINPL